MNKPIKKKKVIVKKIISKDKIITIEIPAMKYRFTVIRTDDLSTAYFKEYKNQYYHTSRLAGMVAHKDLESTIFIRKEIPNLEGVIAHECYHAMKGMERALGNIDGGEEFFAYHLGYLVDKVHEFINSDKVKKKAR